MVQYIQIVYSYFSLSLTFKIIIYDKIVVVKRKRWLILLSIRPQGQLVRQMKDLRLKEQGVQILVLQLVEGQPFEHMGVVPLLTGEAIAPGDEVRFGNVQQEVEA